MKKIRLNVADLDATEVLSRDQLKSIFGGSGSDSLTEGCGADLCNSNSDCGSTCPTCHSTTGSVFHNGKSYSGTCGK